MTHNDWAQWDVEDGVLVTAALLAMAPASLPAAIRSIWGVGVIAVFLHAIVDVSDAAAPGAY